MELSDWPIDTNKQDDGIACDYGACASRDSLFPFRGDTLGELAQSIVEHARAVHGQVIEPSGYWYSAVSPEGQEFLGESSPEEFKAALDYIESVTGDDGCIDDGTWARGRRAVPARESLTYRRTVVFTLSVVEEWTS